MHVLWGVLLMVHRGSIDTAATSLFRHIAPCYQFRAIAYIVSGLLPLVLLRWPGSILGLFSCLPQLIMLLMSGVSAITVITAGAYADGTVKPPIFIAMDQAIYILLAILYAFETLDRYHERPRIQ
jgi:hypothetical protein